MSTDKKRVPFDDLYNLTDEQLTKVIEATESLWESGDVSMITTETGYQIALLATVVDSVTIEGLEISQISSSISSVMSFTNIIVDFDSLDEVQKTFSVPDGDKEKLERIYNKIKKMKYVGEVAYHSSDSSPILDRKTFQFTIKKVINKKYEIPIVALNFSIKTGSVTKDIFFESTHTTLKTLINELKKADKRLEDLKLKSIR